MILRTAATATRTRIRIRVPPLQNASRLVLEQRAFVSVSVSGAACNYYPRQRRRVWSSSVASSSPFSSSAALSSSSSLQVEGAGAGEGEGEEEDGDGDGEKEEEERARFFQTWSLRRLAETNQLDQMKPLVEDIALRLDRQSSLLETLKGMVQTLDDDRNNRSGSGSGSGSGSSSTTITTSTSALTGKKIISTTTRPYWWNWNWNYHQEGQLQDELESALKNLGNLQVLHRDTHKQCLALHQILLVDDAQDQNQNRNGHKKTQPQLLLLAKGIMTEIYTRHSLAMEPLAELVIGLRPLLAVQPQKQQQQQQQQQQNVSFTSTLQALLKSRIVLLLLCDHVVQCTKSKEHGAISKDASIVDLVQQAVTEAQHLCEAHFMTSPPVILLFGPNDDNDTTTTTTALPTLSSSVHAEYLIRPWLQYALVELLKNSMAVTVERKRTNCNRNLNSNSNSNSNCHEDEDTDNDDKNKDDDEEEEEDDPLCPIYIQCHETSEKIVLQIMDQGGGLSFNWSPSKISKKKKKAKAKATTKATSNLFQFASCAKKWDRMQDQQTYAMTRSPLRGLGVGLSMSRLHMETFGGSLELMERSDDDDDDDDSHDIDSDHYSTSLESGMTATIVLPKDYNIGERNLWDHGE